MIPDKYAGVAVFTGAMVAEILGISWKTLSNKRSAGLIDLQPISPAPAKPRFRRTDLEEYLASL